MKYSLFLLLPLLLLACAKNEQTSVIIAGMDKADVLQVKGEPTNTATQSPYTLLYYADQLLEDAPNQKADQAFIFMEDKLMEYSTFNIRSAKDINTPVRLNAKLTLACWANQLNLPVDPSASANKSTITSGRDCFSAISNQNN
ncbi:hypothetical protein [Providencia rettgeri]|uniref:hypothetical protein n=1 Tax=Providencia rettgeri TaxID=587 RepID=UPI0034E0DE56